MNIRRENKELGDIPSSFILQQKGKRKEKIMKVLADFGDFQVVESKTGIDLIDIRRSYKLEEYKEMKKRKNNRERKEIVYTILILGICIVYHYFRF